DADAFLLDRGLVAESIDHRIRALTGHRAGDREPDSGGRAGNDGGFSLQHGSLLPDSTRHIVVAGLLRHHHPSSASGSARVLIVLRRPISLKWASRKRRVARWPSLCNRVKNSKSLLNRLRPSNDAPCSSMTMRWSRMRRSPASSSARSSAISGALKVI